MRMMDENHPPPSPPTAPDSIIIKKFGQCGPVDKIHSEKLSFEVLRGTKYLRKNCKVKTPVEVDKFAPPPQFLKLVKFSQLQ